MSKSKTMGKPDWRQELWKGGVYGLDRFSPPKTSFAGFEADELLPKGWVVEQFQQLEDKVGGVLFRNKEALPRDFEWLVRELFKDVKERIKGAS